MCVLAHRPRDGLSVFWRESRHVALGQLWELVPATLHPGPDRLHPGGVLGVRDCLGAKALTLLLGPATSPAEIVSGGHLAPAWNP